jgi:sortase A
MSTTEAPPAPDVTQSSPRWVNRLTAGRGRRPTGPREPMSPTRAAIVVTFGVLAALAVWFVFYALVLSGLEEGHDQHVLYDELRAHLSSEQTPFGGAIKPGTPVALITAPSIGLRSVVVEGTSSKDLTAGPGHFPASPMPGQAGISVLFGRSATFGAPFGKITSLRAGAPIVVTTGQGQFVFKVEDVRKPGDPLPAVLPANAAGLALVTSEGSGWRSGWAPSQAVYVDAKLAHGKVVATPPGRPTVAAAADQTLAGDDGNLIALVLWLQAAVLVVAGILYARTKLTAWQLWLLGLPIILAVLWGVSSQTMILLPNLA